MQSSPQIIIEDGASPPTFLQAAKPLIGSMCCLPRGPLLSLHFTTVSTADLGCRVRHPHGCLKQGSYQWCFIFSLPRNRGFHWHLLFTLESFLLHQHSLQWMPCLIFSSSLSPSMFCVQCAFYNSAIVLGSIQGKGLFFFFPLTSMSCA